MDPRLRGDDKENFVPKKSASKVLSPLPIPCACNCKTCIQRIVAGDVVKIEGRQYQIAKRKDCACVTTKGGILYCEDFLRANVRVTHLSIPRLSKQAIILVAEFRI